MKNWEEKFDERFGNGYISYMGGINSEYESNPKEDMDDLKQFIKEIISNKNNIKA